MTLIPPFDLRARARRAMLEQGFTPDMPPAASVQMQRIAPAPPLPPGVKDLRNLLWSSIDNDDSRDLDQIEYVEPLDGGSLRVLVGIADVDALVASDTPVDLHARDNTTSVYTGVEMFPMLPEALSTDLTSLLEGEDRQIIVVELTLDLDGKVTQTDIYPALAANKAQLTYGAVGAWLENRAPVPPGVAKITGLAEQIWLQQQAAHRILARRLAQGALEFDTAEARPVVQNGQVVSLTADRQNEANILIANFMIAANTAMATFMAASGQPSLQRVVRAPERWPRIVEIAARLGETLPATPDALALSGFLIRRKAADPQHFADLSLSIVKLLGPGEYAVVDDPTDPQGHFGLAAYRYTHSTAPNRRYADLIVQRLLKAVRASAPPPYSLDELTQLAAHCTERENASRKVERLMRKVSAAALLRGREGQIFDALVTGASPKGSFVRLLAPPVEGRVVRNEAGMDVGDHARVRLLATDPERGFIDFERI